MFYRGLKFPYRAVVVVAQESDAANYLSEKKSAVLVLV
jgi:hypothetical protein